MKSRDLSLLDALSALDPVQWRGPVWRACVEGRSPAVPGPSVSRWCDGTFNVLYTAMDADGAISEVHSYLSMQPVFPSRARWLIHRLEVLTDKVLHLADMDALEKLGVDTSTYLGREYSRTQKIANAATFMGFDGLIAPSARFRGHNLMLFGENLGHDWLVGADDEGALIDWQAWRTRRPS